MDPNFSVLLDYDAEDKCSPDDGDNIKKGSKRVNTKIIAGVVGGVGGAIVLGTIIFISLPKAKNWWKTRKASRNINLDNFSNTNDNMVIEKAPDMVVNTASGRYVVNL